MSANYADWQRPLYQSANRIAHLYFFTDNPNAERFRSSVVTAGNRTF